MKLAVTVTLKKDVLDPQGKVVEQTLKDLGVKSLNSIRQGKYFEIDLNVESKEEAVQIADDMCKKLLSNLIIEEYKINII